MGNPSRSVRFGAVHGGRGCLHCGHIARDGGETMALAQFALLIALLFLVFWCYCREAEAGS